MTRIVYHRRVPATPSPSTGKWLIKSEPDVYGWDRFVKEGKTRWDGVRNYTARNHLRAMKVGDLAFYYHSNEGKQIVGVARVKKAAYPDPTADEGDWSAVDFEPAFPLVSPVTLAAIKAAPALAKMQLVTLGRMSVTMVTDAEWKIILQMAKTKR
jgi:predicted RNA-binding protein with PUA-like domain